VYLPNGKKAASSLGTRKMWALIGYGNGFETSRGKFALRRVRTSFEGKTKFGETH